MPFTLDWGQITVTTLATTAATTYINFLLYKRQKDHDFKQVYQKMMLEKKLEAYQKVESVINRLKITDNLKTGKLLLDIYATVDPGKPNDYHKLLVDAYDLWNSSILISEKILERMKPVFNLLNDDYRKIRESQENPIELGIKNSPYIIGEMKQLRILLIAELLNLHDIEGSLKTKMATLIDYMKAQMNH